MYQNSSTWHPMPITKKLHFKIYSHWHPHITSNYLRLCVLKPSKIDLHYLTIENQLKYLPTMVWFVCWDRV